jgi:hypothetical protein
MNNLKSKPKVMIEVTEREAMAELNDAGPHLNYTLDRHLPLRRNAEFRPLVVGFAAAGSLFRHPPRRG